MMRIYVICEGQTEETFVNELLAPVFAPRHIFLLPSIVGKPGHKGGNVKFERLFTDIRHFLLNNTTAYCTTFIDYYGLRPDFPGKSAATQKAPISDKAAAVQEGMVSELKRRGLDEALRRFIPYVQMHEYEGLLFSDPAKFAKGIYQPTMEAPFRAIREQFSSPEAINDDPNSAPSKRILALVPQYEKPIYGLLAATEIGLATMRAECTLFDNWLKRLAALG